MNQKIGVLRWIFDPVHEWHYANMTCSISELNLDELNIVTKFLWDKDPVASLEQRKAMLDIQIWNTEIIKVLTQNIRWHIAHLLEFWEIYHDDTLVQIWWSDKINREMKVYWKKWNIFLVRERDEFKLDNETAEIAEKIWITLLSISPKPSISSTFIRWELLKNRDKKPIWLNESIYNYILENDLYLMNKRNFVEYVKHRDWFIEFLCSDFPEIKLSKLNIPEFNQLHHIDWWKEKFIRFVVNQKWLEWDKLEEFVERSLQYNY